ncbi:MAG: hypothetical protein KBD42_13965, partial [Chitinophagales bacterium]|nr:hypothetical protein [Chitinophagales bacterium]
RYRQGSEIKLALDKIISDFDVIHPEKSVDALLKVYTQLENTPTDQLVEFKKQQLQNIIVACLGLWLEPVAEKDMVVQGEEIKIFSSSIKRNEYPLTLESITVLNNEYKAGEILPAGINQLDTFEIRISGNLKSSPYWLDDDYNGLFTISDQKNRGKAENDPLLSFIYNVKIGEQLFNIKRAVVYKETDAVKGEIYKPLSIIPEYYIELDQNNIFLHQDAPTEISFSVYANRDLANAPLVIKSDNMDKQTSEKVFIDLKKGETRNYKVKVKPTGQLTNFGFYKIRSDSLFIFDENANERVVTTDTYFEAGSNYIIEYDHIPRQVVFEQATVKIINADIKIPQIKIAYIEGAGDKVDESLQQIGLNITTIAPEAITLNELKKYEAVVIGVRAYNTSKVLADNQSILMQYVNEGGLVITQYNTNWDMYTEIIGPYPFKIKRGRVTDENSPVDFLLPEHSVLNTPNKLTKADFDGWIQERGIYFAEELAPEYVSPLAFTDPNEKPQSGSLIIADYGKGAFMYTGIAFFRELPAGVPGAYRLFINLLSYKNQGK